MAAISPPYSGGNNRGFLSSGFDWALLALVLLLSVWGCATISSARSHTERQSLTARSATARPGESPAGGQRDLSEATKQAAFVVVGLTAMACLAIGNYRWLMHLQGWIYFGNLLMLTLLLFLPSSIAPVINGAKSWVTLGPISLQISEFSKFAMLVAMAAFITRRQEKLGELKTVLLSLAYLMPPLLLIMKQPDFGTTVATLSIWFGMLFFGGAKLKHLGLIALVGALLFAGAWKTKILKPHQQARLASFLAPEDKAQGDAYQLQQSLLAIGGGQITGQGYGVGVQNRARSVPENHTDFIFTVVAEELGFAGAATLLIAYLLLVTRTAGLALSTDNYFGVLLCGGFTALLAFHCVINLGMTMRVMPITGVPLPFFSYGGSSYLAFSLCTGLVQSVAAHRR